MVDTNNPKISEDVSALRDAYFWVPVGEPGHTASRIHRILDALEEAREVVSEAAMCQLCGGNPCSRADDETGCIDPDNICSHKARAFLAKYGESDE